MKPSITYKKKQASLILHIIILGILQVFPKLVKGIVEGSQL